MNKINNLQLPTSPSSAIALFVELIRITNINKSMDVSVFASDNKNMLNYFYDGADRN